MKMTMHIDESLLETVKTAYGFESKTETINAALHEMDRRLKLRAYAKAGLGFSGTELKDAVEPGYDILASRGVKLARHGS